MDSKQIDVMVADASHEVYVDKILDTIREAAKVRGTGIAERTHEYVATKMKEGKAIIALCGDEFAGFTYIESWGNKQYVATSGLIVHPDYRAWDWPNVSRRFFPPGTPAVAQSQDIQSDQRSGRYENEYRTGLRTGYFQ